MAEPSKEVFEMFQKMINPMAFPLQSLLTTALSPEELDKKIVELSTVKHWLETNASMLELTIKSLEYQKALLTATNEGARAMENMPENPLLNPALWPWAAMMNAAGEAAAGTAPAAAAKTK